MASDILCLQVVAITIFFLLVIAFYIFMAPFLWTRGLDAAAYAIYTPLVRNLPS